MRAHIAFLLYTALEGESKKKGFCRRKDKDGESWATGSNSKPTVLARHSSRIAASSRHTARTILFPNWMGVDQTRTASVEGDTLNYSDPAGLERVSVDHP
jgi:hypothetical protein